MLRERGTLIRRSRIAKARYGYTRTLATKLSDGRGPRVLPDGLYADRASLWSRGVGWQKGVNLPGRLILSLGLALMLALMSVFPAIAWTNGTCSTTAGACIYDGGNFALPKDGTCCSVAAYSGNFFNSAVARDNNTSSVKNLFTSKDVSWYWNPSYGGFNWCIDSGDDAPDLGLLDNDKFSSHLVHSNDSAC